MRMKSKGFRVQLFLTMSVILGVVLIVTSIITFLVTRSYAYEDSRALVREQLEQTSRRAFFHVLVGKNDPKLVADFLAEVAQMRSVLAVELLDGDGVRLGVAGVQPEALGQCGFRSAEAASRLYEVRKEPLLWCGIAPVRESVPRPSGEHENVGAVRGEVRMVSSPANVGQMMRELALWNLGAGVAVLCAGMLLAWREVNRLAHPLRRLADVMRRLREERSRIRAALEGPEEVVSIARVFNDLLERLEEEAGRLESRVDERTRELNTAMEQARRAERSKTVLWAMLSHEMRTPLHVILSHAHSVISELKLLDGSAEAQEDTEIIIKEVGELLRRVNQILDLARAETGQQAIDREAFELKEFSTELYEQNTPHAAENGNMLTVESDNACIVTDRDKALQIASNIVNNACKFTRDGTVQVFLRVCDATLDITVSDTGPGISPEEQSGIWHEFKQARTPGRKGVRGFGLGLAIVDRYTKLLGGQIELDSRIGRGTTVRVRLPVQVEKLRAQAL